nr:uncharacterized protein [Candida metapsilosis]
MTTTLPSSILFDSAATSDVSTVTPSLSNLHMASDVHNYANEGGSVQTISASSKASSESESDSPSSSSSVTGLLFASESSELTQTGSFAASSDVKTLDISSSSTKGGSSSSSSSSSSEGSLDNANGVGSVVQSMKGSTKCLLMFSIFTVASMVVSL